MVLQKMRVSQKLSQIPGVSSSRIFMEGLLGVSISFSMLRKSRARRKCISLAVSQSLAYTIRHPFVRLFVSCDVVRQLRFIVHQNECLRLYSFRTRYIHMSFTLLRFITHIDCLSRASLFGNSALSCIEMNVYGCILLECGIYT